jgi:hypothetical protein
MNIRLATVIVLVTLAVTAAGAAPLAGQTAATDLAQATPADPAQAAAPTVVRTTPTGPVRTGPTVAPTDPVQVAPTDLMVRAVNPLAGEWQEPPRSDWRLLRVAKWTTATASAGLAVWGVVNNRRADQRFEALEQECLLDPARCEDRLPNGSYADPALEAQYQDVRDMDRNARTALIAGQVGLATSVVLFILDLRNNSGPSNIPYEPRRIDVTPARDGGMSLRLNLALPH